MSRIANRPSQKRLAGLRLTAGAALVLGMTACASGPQASTPTGPQSGPLNTGTYPNLNVQPETAAAPITDQDKASLTGRLAAAKSRQAADGVGVGTKGDPAYLKKLAESHGDDTLKAIAAE